MDTFSVNDCTFNKDNFINACFIRWEIHWRKSCKQSVICVVLSLICLLLGVFKRTEENTINLSILLGIGFLIVNLFLVCFELFVKRRYIREVKEIANKYDSVKMDCNYEFSEESVKYWDKEKDMEFNWSVFTNYSIYKDYLILFLNNSIFESYLFKKEEIGIDEYNKLLEVVKSKLEYKEIK